MYDFWLNWALGLFATGILAAFRWLIGRQKAMGLGMQALLRDRILTAYYHYEERGWITLHGLENVEAMYEQYHALGGNGTVTKLVEDLRKLEVRDQ